MARSYRQSSVIKDFGQWVVTKFGLECSEEYYPISARQLREPISSTNHGWLKHMAEKEWVMMGSFRQAYEFAVKYHAKK